MFKKAVPVWISCSSFDDALNRHLIFRQSLPSLDGLTLKIAAADFYRVTVNGEFLGFGPARTALGYARVDEYSLSGKGKASGGENIIIIEVAGFACKSLSTVYQDSFFSAEIEKNGEVICFTGRDFECFHNMRRIRKVERFSVQRHFGEIRDERIADPFSEEYRAHTVSVASNVQFIERSVPMPSFCTQELDGYVSRGTFVPFSKPYTQGNAYVEGAKKNAYSFPPDREANYGMFPEEEIPDKPFRYITALEAKKTDHGAQFPVTLSGREWIMVDFNVINAGFLRWAGEAWEEADVILAFTELCDDDAFSFRKINMQCVIEYHLPAGKGLQFESFEPYTFRQVAIFVKSGSVKIDSIGYRSYVRDTSGVIKRTFRNEKLNEFYSAAVRSFAHNAVDLFTDCPSRERAGWLCDSFFTGRAEYFLYQKTPIEDAFLENYVLFGNTGEYPQGVLPMCYPSSRSQGGKFIPQWNMWYVMEVCEYLTLRNPGKDREIFRPSVFGILSFLEKYENSLGLLENLPSWNFIEWSDANSWTQDISYPTNFLYAALLDAVADTFSRPELRSKAEKVRKKTIAMSFNGELFVDHARRNADGSYTNEMHISEACQYYALLYGGISIYDEAYAKLKWYVEDNFSSFAPGDYQFCPINAFIGFYLRMNLLIELKDARLLARDLESFCEKMVSQTGTLWEYKDGKGSLDHGFASYLALAIPLVDSLPQ